MDQVADHLVPPDGREHDVVDDGRQVAGTVDVGDELFGERGPQATDHGPMVPPADVRDGPAPVRPRGRGAPGLLTPAGSPGRPCWRPSAPAAGWGTPRPRRPRR
ncbi:hypothetical protein [Ornithinimicrobium kibberense]|uniref:hypothetical protein n=1 Tax=Ornithinimicrobium kibberense TaxID=282060 RepID=UPI0036201F2B